MNTETDKLLLAKEARWNQAAKDLPSFPKGINATERRLVLTGRLRQGTR